MAYDSTKPPDDGSLVAADIRENFRALKEDDIVEGIAVTLTAGTGLSGGGALTANRTVSHAAHTGDVTGTTALTIGAAKVSQSKLKTTLASVNGSTGNVTLPGGEYGFYPQIKATFEAENGCIYIANNFNNLTYVTNIYFGSSGGYTIYAQQRYITSSGEVHWVFILRDKMTKQVISMWQAPDHPCFGNGSKPLLTPHPFGSYDELKHEIIVINPTNEEIEQMELETIVEDETKPDKDLLEVIAENYEIDEDSNPAWPTKEVTVGLPKHIVDKKTGKKVLADYRFMPPGTIINSIKKKIPKPDYIKVKKLKKRNN